MTKREAAIVSAYTGILIGKFSDMNAYIEEKLGTPIWTHQLTDEKLWEEIKEAVTTDFINITIKED